MNAPPSPPHVHGAHHRLDMAAGISLTGLSAVGLGGRPNIVIFDNLGVNHTWSCIESADEFGRALWVVTLVAIPINNHAGGQTHYVGSGSRKAYAKDAAACHYLVLNQVVPPSPLAL